MPKTPNLKETIQVLRNANVALEKIWSSIREELERYENIELPAAILKKARKLHVDRVSTSWIQRHFRLGYSRAARLIDVMQDMRLLETTRPPQGSGYRIRKPARRVARR